MLRAIVVVCFFLLILGMILFSRPCRASDTFTWDCEYWLKHLSEVQTIEDEILDLRIKLLKHDINPGEYYGLTFEIQKLVFQLRSSRIEVNLDIESEDVRKMER